MKKQFKRILALALTVLMVVGVVPMAIFAVAADAPADKVGKYIAPNAEELQAALGDSGELMFYYPFSGSDFNAGSYTNGKGYSYARAGATVFDGSSVLLKASSDAGKANLPMYTQGGSGYTEQPGDKADANRAFVYSFDIKATDYGFGSGFSCAVRSKMMDASNAAKYMDKPIFTLTATAQISVGGNVVATLSTEVYTNFAIAVNPDPEVNTYTVYINGEEVASGTFLAANDYTTMAGYGYDGFCFSQIYMSYESSSNKNRALAYFDNVTAYWGDTFIKGETLTYTGTKYDSAIKYEDLNAVEAEFDIDALGDKLYYYNNFEGDERGTAAISFTNATSNIVNGALAPLAAGGGTQPHVILTPAAGISGKFILSFDYMIEPQANNGVDCSAGGFFNFTGESKEWFRVYGNPFGTIHPLFNAASAGQLSDSSFVNCKYLIDTDAKTVTLFVGGVATYNNTFGGGEFTSFDLYHVRQPGADKIPFHVDNVLLYQYEEPESPFDGTMKHFGNLDNKNGNKVFGDINGTIYLPDSTIWHKDGRGGYAVEGTASNNYYALQPASAYNAAGTLKGESFVLSADFKYVPGKTLTGQNLLVATAYGANAGSYGRDFNVTFVYVAPDGSLWLATEAEEGEGVIVNAWRYTNTATIGDYYTEQIGQLNPDTFTNVAVAVDVANNTFKVYVDGIEVVTDAKFLSDADYLALSETADYADGFGVTFSRFELQPGKILDNPAFYYAADIIESKKNTDPITGFIDTAAGVAYYEDGFRQTGELTVGGKNYVTNEAGAIYFDGLYNTPYGFYVVDRKYVATTSVDSADIVAIDSKSDYAFLTLEDAVAGCVGNVVLYSDYTSLDVFENAKAATIDLNGKVFDVAGIVETAALSFVDSGATKGLIKAEGLALTNTNAASVLAYDADLGGYVVFSVTNNKLDPAVAANGRLEFKFRPSLDNNTAYNTQFLANAVDSGLALYIDVVAKDAEGNQVGETLKLEADADLLASVYADNTKALKLSIGGYETFASVSITYMIESAGGTYNVGTVTYTAPVVEA